MPAGLAAIHPRFGTPWVALVVSATLYAAFAVFSFKELIVLDVWLYSLALLIEFAAFVRLRVREPGLARRWRVPGGRGTVLLMAGAPAALSLLAMATAGWLNTLVGRADRARGVSRDSSRFSSMTWARHSSVDSE